MSGGHTKGAPPLGLERFAGKKGEFTMWKDKVLTHINQQDQEYERGLLEKNQPEATVLMVDFLEDKPEKPVVSLDSPSQDEARSTRWKIAHWTRARTAMQNLFNQALPNAFLSTLPDAVSKMDPCEVWKLLEQQYGLGDAGGVIELKRQWTNLMASNWRDLGTLFAHMKKLRNDLNRKSKGLVGKEMMTEPWLCVEVLSLLPSEFWASSVVMTPEWFTIENVEVSLRRVFGDHSKKEIGLLTEKRGSVSINVAKKHVGKKRRQDETTVLSTGDCFYCFKPGHMKKDCPLKAKDRDPKRPGGQLFRTDINTAPGTRKKQKVMTVKASESSKAVASGESTDKTTLEKSIEASELDAVEGFAYQGDVPLSDDDGAQSMAQQMEIDEEELGML